ncbi:UNVERIFIED_CONTAM: putative mitochondrial protein [Sesamum latifolium]|uniref:Mitochondrial protein n=1 Tax=Sesamum latifolium TaxID=2727402 RepID=A0AAW2T9C7_9LAMI
MEASGENAAGPTESIEGATFGGIRAGIRFPGMEASGENAAGPTESIEGYSHRTRLTTTTPIDPPGLPPATAPGTHLLHRPMISPLLFAKALPHPAWKMVMDEEMSALISRGTWELVEPPPKADVVACRWIFTLKFWADETLEWYKARLVAKGFTQTNGVDYFEIVSPVARLNSIRVLFFLAVNLSWPMYHMYIKNIFLYGDLNEIVYMEQPPGYVAHGEKQHTVCKLKKAIYGLKQSLKHGMVILAVYVDDILITGSDAIGIEEAKTYLRKHFVIKDLGRPSYFLGIEIAHNKHGVSLSQRKYACDLLQEAGLLGTKSVDAPMDSNPNFWNDDDNYLEDKTKCRRLVGKLIYLIVTRFDISFFVGLVRQSMDKPRLVHWKML